MYSMAFLWVLARREGKITECFRERHLGVEESVPFLLFFSCLIWSLVFIQFYQQWGYCKNKPVECHLSPILPLFCSVFVLEFETKQKYSSDTSKMDESWIMDLLKLHDKLNLWLDMQFMLGYTVLTVFLFLNFVILAFMV